MKLELMDGGAYISSKPSVGDIVCTKTEVFIVFKLQHSKRTHVHKQNTYKHWRIVVFDGKSLKIKTVYEKLSDDILS